MRIPGDLFDSVTICWNALATSAAFADFTGLIQVNRDRLSTTIKKAPVLLLLRMGVGKKAKSE